MCVKALGEVSQVLASGAKFLREQANMVRVPKHLLEQEARLCEVAGAGKAFHIPERAHGEGAFVAMQAVLARFGLVPIGLVAIDETVGNPDATDSVDAVGALWRPRSRRHTSLFRVHSVLQVDTFNFKYLAVRFAVPLGLIY